jgi:thiamine kinase-like enzyme
MPSIKETGINWVNFLQPYLPAEQWEKLSSMMKAIPEPEFMIHGDYHANNVMIQNGEPLLIDMDTLCMGHPVFELGSMFNAFLGYSELDHETTMKFFGYTHETAEKLWNMSLKKYLGTEDEAVCRSVAEKAMVIGYTRMLRRAVRRPEEEDSPAKIARCKERLAELLAKVETLDFEY